MNGLYSNDPLPLPSPAATGRPGDPNAGATVSSCASRRRDPQSRPRHGMVTGAHGAPVGTPDLLLPLAVPAPVPQCVVSPDGTLVTQDPAEAREGAAAVVSGVPAVVVGAQEAAGPLSRYGSGGRARVCPAPASTLRWSS